MLVGDMDVIWLERVGGARGDEAVWAGGEEGWGVPAQSMLSESAMSAARPSMSEKRK